MGVDEIGKIALLTFCKSWGASDHEVQSAMKIGLTPGAKQMHVDCLLDHKSCRKAALALARSVPRGVRFGQLEIPAGIEGIVTTDNNVSLRIITTYDLVNSRNIMRIDALFVEPQMPIHDVPARPS